MAVWDDLLTDLDKKVLDKGGWGKSGAVSWESRGLGNHPAVLVIDMQEMIVGRNVPILEAMDDFRTAMGEIAWKHIEPMQKLLAEAREKGIPVCYTRVIPRSFSAQDDATQIVAPIAPQEGDIIVEKNFASAFYGTSFLTDLVTRRIDTLIIIGNSTSGCVRATTVDAKQHGFQTILVEDCIFDRIEASHKIGLLDMWMKYAELMTLEQVFRYIEGLES